MLLITQFAHTHTGKNIISQCHFSHCGINFLPYKKLYLQKSLLHTLELQIQHFEEHEFG